MVYHEDADNPSNSTAFDVPSSHHLSLGAEGEEKNHGQICRWSMMACGGWLRVAGCGWREAGGRIN